MTLLERIQRIDARDRQAVAQWLQAAAHVLRRESEYTHGLPLAAEAAAAQEELLQLLTQLLVSEPQH